MYTKDEIRYQIANLKQQLKDYKTQITFRKKEVKARVKSQSFQLFRKFGKKYKCTSCWNTFDANLFCLNCGYQGNRRERPGKCPSCWQRIKYNVCTICWAQKDLEASKIWNKNLKELDKELNRYKKMIDKQITQLKKLLKKAKY